MLVDNIKRDIGELTTNKKSQQEHYAVNYRDFYSYPLFTRTTRIVE